MGKKVSIIIPVYNGSEYLKDAIDSALNQTYTNIEVIVVNDGSNDDNKTRQLALSYGDKIKYLEKDNGGVSSALNYGIEKMTGEYFSWLSHDDIYENNKIELEIEALEKAGKDVIVYSDAAVLFMNTGHSIRLDLAKYYSEKVLTSGLLALCFWLIDGISLLIPKVYFEEKGLFDTDFRGAQDYLKWLELFGNEKLVFLDDCLVCRRIHDKQQGVALGSRMIEEEDVLIQKLLAAIDSTEFLCNDIEKYSYKCMLIEKAYSKGCEYAVQHGIKEGLDRYDVDKDIIQEKQIYLYKKLMNGSRYLYIYGAGKKGRELVERLKRRNIWVDGFIDLDDSKWGKMVDGICCFNIGTAKKEEACVIVSILDYYNIEKYLQENGYSNIKLYKEIDELIGTVPFLAEEL